MQFDCHEDSRSYEKFLIRTDGKERQDEEEGIFLIFCVFLLSDNCAYICYLWEILVTYSSSFMLHLANFS